MRRDIVTRLTLGQALGPFLSVKPIIPLSNKIHESLKRIAVELNRDHISAFQFADRPAGQPLRANMPDARAG